jgi:hypothetical protein
MNYKKGEELWEILPMENFLCAARSWMPDSGYWIMADFRDGQWTMDAAAGSPGLGLQEDITKKGRVLPMENGQWKGGSAGNQTPASHFITDYCWAGAMGNGEWRRISSSCSPCQGCTGNVHLGTANAPSPAMEWTMAPGKM